MTDLRDKIAQTFSDTYIYGGKPLVEAADAILATIRENVPPLVWVDNGKGGIFSDTDVGCYAVIRSRDKGRTIYLACMRGYSIDKIMHGTIEAAKAAANAHHVNAVLKAAGLSHD